MPPLLHNLRLPAFFSVACCLLLACNSAPSSRSEQVNLPPTEELFSEANREDILAAARAIISTDPVAALVTIDHQGRSRIRSVKTSEPDSNMSIWIATRPSTRKVEQIQGNPNVSLYYNNDPDASYLSIMGTASTHSDLATIEAHNPFNEEQTSFFWPEYPKDIVVIEIRPVWLEVTGQGISSSDDTWRPQAVIFD